MCSSDLIIELADNNTATDLVDTGWFSPAGDGVKIWYSGLARIANKSSNTKKPVVKEARELGLTYVGSNKYANSLGEVTHINENGNLIEITK